MTKKQRIHVAYVRYKLKLRKQGASEFAINLAFSSGIDFLHEYENAHKEKR